MNRVLTLSLPLLGILAACGTRLVVGDAPGPSGSSGPGTSSGEAGAFGSDGGASIASWQWLNPNPVATGNNLLGIWGTAASDQWLVGEAGTVLHWDGSTISAPNTGATASDTFYTVWSSGPSDVWIGGDGTNGTTGRILHWDGQTWSSAYSITNQRIHSIWGTGPTDVWALTDDTLQGHIQHWDGSVWSLSYTFDQGNPTVTGFLRDIWGTAGSAQWIVGNGGLLLQPTGSFGDWTASRAAAPGTAVDPFSPNLDYVGVWGSATNDVWAMFVDSSLSCLGFAHWDGSAWNIAQDSQCANLFHLPTGPLRRGHALGGIDANTVVSSCLPQLGDMFVWGGAGLGWQETGNCSEAVWGDGAGHLFGAGDFGAFLRFDPSATDVQAGQSGWVSTAGARFDFSRLAPVGGQEAWATETLSEQNSSGLDHWDGTTWSQVPFSGGAFLDVGASSPTDVWAAGWTSVPSQAQSTGELIHWDGTTWSEPMVIPQAQWFTGVWVQNPTNAWAVGGSASDYLLVEHWDGNVWSSVPVPTYLTQNSAQDSVSYPQVFGVSGTEVWISAIFVAGSSTEWQPFVLRWDGNALAEIARPPGISASGFSPYIPKLWGASPNDLWLPEYPALHFDGSQWSRIDGGGDDSTSAIFGTSAEDVWLVGEGPQGGAIRHWDGTTLTTVVDATPTLSSIAITPQHDFLWAVGQGGATLRLATSPSGPTP